MITCDYVLIYRYLVKAIATCQIYMVTELWR